ncbi:MAG: STAS domain-containing protein [Acidimicrobiales bacterium]
MVPEEPRAEVVLLRGDVEVASWALRGRGKPDLATVDELARLQLAAKRMGCSIWLRRACPDLVWLLRLAGLGDRLQALGEAEGGEEVGVEEVVVPDDQVP